MRHCFSSGCRNPALPYSAFCVNHTNFNDFSHDERKKQAEFLSKIQGKKTNLFTVKCHQCGDLNPLDNDEILSIHVYFKKGTENTLDRMVFYCRNCGNFEDHPISWQLDVNEPL